MSDTYFVISNSDGATTVEMLTGDVLRKRLNECWGGDPKFISPNDKIANDTNYWGDSVMIIKGEIVVPKPKQTITEYEV